MDRAGLRGKLLRAQAEAGDIVLLFGDESEALPSACHPCRLRRPGTLAHSAHPSLAHAWARRGADLRVPAAGQAKKVAMLGVLDWARRDLVVHTSRTKRSTDFAALLAEVDRRYGPKPGRDTKPVVLVLDTPRSRTVRAPSAGRARLPSRPRTGCHPHRRIRRLTSTSDRLEA